jgi:hypothetical protein
MSSLLQSRRPEFAGPWPVRWPHFTQTVVLAAPVVPLCAVVLLVRVPLVLPSLSLVSIASAAGIALLAWWIPVHRASDRITLWDVAGLYAFLGCAAAMLSEPAHVMEFVALPAGGPEAMGKVQ